MDPCRFHSPSQMSFLFLLFHFFHSTYGHFDEKSLPDASLSCGNEATSTFMTQHITALWLQESFWNSCCSVVDLDSNLYACTRVVHRGRKSQMNCALGQELCCNFPKWPSSTGGECVYCSLMLVFWVFFNWLRFDYGGWGIFFFPQELGGSRYKNEHKRWNEFVGNWVWYRPWF